LKISNRYVCDNCAYESSKWLGKCPACGLWNTLQEEARGSRMAIPGKPRTEAVSLQSVPTQDIRRGLSGVAEFDRVLGGGMVPGSVILLGGNPGIGKSTLLLQVAQAIAQQGDAVLYLCGEESLQQIRLRSLRLKVDSPSIFLLAEQNIELLADYIEEIKPSTVIIDSIQAVYCSEVSSIPGSIAQLRECTARIIDIAKRKGITFFLIGHVTKEGVIAGPKVLEHMVDVVISFEGEKSFSFRILRAVKNRFGSTDEIGLLEMGSAGLHEVLDPASIFLSSHPVSTSGTAITTSVEGSRPLLIEVQALVCSSGPGYPKRMATGIDQNRLALSTAVLEKRLGFHLSACDVFLKITGGVFLKDPSVDFGIAAAIISSHLDLILPADTVFIGELGLSGQIRPVPYLELRMKEIAKMGYQRVIIPKQGKLPEVPNLAVIEIQTVDELLELIREG